MSKAPHQSQPSPDDFDNMTSPLLLFHGHPSASPLVTSDMTGLQIQYRQEMVISTRQVQHVPTQPASIPSLAQPYPSPSTALRNPSPAFPYSGSDLPPLEPPQPHFPSDLGLPQPPQRDFNGRTLYPYQPNLDYQYLDPLAPQTLNEFPFPSVGTASLSAEQQQPLGFYPLQQSFDVDRLFASGGDGASFTPDPYHTWPQCRTFQNTSISPSQPLQLTPAVAAPPTMTNTIPPTLLHLPQRPADRLVPRGSAPNPPLAQQPLRPSLRQTQSYNPPYPSRPDFGVGIDPLQTVGYGQAGLGTAGAGAGGSLGRAAASSFKEGYYVPYSGPRPSLSRSHTASTTARSSTTSLQSLQSLSSFTSPTLPLAPLSPRRASYETDVSLSPDLSPDRAGLSTARPSTLDSPPSAGTRRRTSTSPTVATKWEHVQDKKERRKMQNRMAQRKFRARVREEKRAAAASDERASGTTLGMAARSAIGKQRSISG